MEILASIAKQHLGFVTLETRNSDSLDFRDIPVWQVKDALEAAFRAGVESATNVIAKQLVMILDDVEGIAELLDHEYPAERHAASRAFHISECATRLHTIVNFVRAMDADESVVRQESVKVTFKANMNDGWFLGFIEDNVAIENPMRFCQILGTNLAVRFEDGDFRYYRDGQRVQYGIYHTDLLAFMAAVRENQKVAQ